MMACACAVSGEGASFFRFRDEKKRSVSTVPGFLFGLTFFGAGVILRQKQFLPPAGVLTRRPAADFSRLSSPTKRTVTVHAGESLQAENDSRGRGFS
jgi:hypothetical protein